MADRIPNLEGRAETEKAVCDCLSACIRQGTPPPFFVAELIDRIAAGEIPNLRYVQPQQQKEGHPHG